MSSGTNSCLDVDWRSAISMAIIEQNFDGNDHHADWVVKINEASFK